jgi:hypothetical protein
VQPEGGAAAASLRARVSKMAETVATLPDRARKLNVFNAIESLVGRMLVGAGKSIKEV